MSNGENSPEHYWALIVGHKVDDSEPERPASLLIETWLTENRTALKRLVGFKSIEVSFALSDNVAYAGYCFYDSVVRLASEVGCALEVVVVRQVS